MHDVNEGPQKGKHLVCREGRGRGFSWRFSHHLLPTKETAGSQTGGVAPGCWRCHWAKNLLPQTELPLMRTMMKTSFVIVTAAANCCSPEKILRHQPKHQETNTLIFDNHKPPFWFLFPLTIGQFVRKTALPYRKQIMWKMSSFTSNRFHHFRYVVNVGSCYIHIPCIDVRTMTSLQLSPSCCVETGCNTFPRLSYLSITERLILNYSFSHLLE